MAKALATVKQLDLAIRATRQRAIASAKEFKPLTFDEPTLTLGKGLQLKVYADPMRHSLWVARVFQAGRERQIGLGAFPAVSLAQARQEIERSRLQVSQAGVTPADLRREKIQGQKEEQKAQEQQAQATFEAAARHWHAGHCASLTNQRYAAQIISTLERHVFPVIGAMSIDTIQATDILDKTLMPMLSNKSSNGKPDPLVETARKAFQQISAVIEDAGRRGLCKSNPASLVGRELTKRLKQARKVKPEGQFAALTDRQEIGRLLRKLAAVRSMTTRCGVLLSALCANRSGELRMSTFSQFSDLDGPEPTWTIPRMNTKTKKADHVIPLSRQAAALVRELREFSQGHDLLFPSPTDPIKPISDNTLSKWLRDNGYRGKMTPHGFRATFSSLATELGYRTDAVEAALAHTVQGVRGHYQRSTLLQERRRNAQSWADFLDGLRDSASD